MNTSDAPRRGIVTGLSTWTEVLGALMAREMRTRFAGGRLGYLWAYIIPMAWIGGLVASFSYIGRTPPILSDVPTFVATGMLPYVIFRQTISAMSRAPAANRGLAHFPTIGLNDVLAATALLELLSGLVLFAIVMAAISLWRGWMPLDDAAGVLAGLVLAWGLGAGFGRLAAILIQISDFAQRIIPVALRPMFWISGIFFTAQELPPALLKWFSFNPLLHAIEILRTGYFTNYTSQMATPTVPIAFIAACYFGSHALQAWRGGRDGRGFVA